MKKIDFIKDKIREANILACPICSESIEVDDYSIRCTNNHTFDISKKGYIFLLRKEYRSNYSKQLFEERKKAIADGLFDKLFEEILKIVKSLNKSSVTVLDAGCGEGSLVRHLSSCLNNVEIIGMDISKTSIAMASRGEHHDVWIVADIARIPILDSKIDLIINVLSPANYEEFIRILADSGRIIKVVPGSDYLKELREVVDKEGYSNLDVVKKFTDNFERTKVINLKYKFKVNEDLLRSITFMTPLMWGNKLTNKELENIDSVTMDFLILYGKNQPKQ